MFGMGGSEILVILVIALLFLGPEKLPGAAKSISKGIRDIKKQSRALQHQIESDEQIGGAIRDLKSALRGEEPPRPIRPRPQIAPPVEPAELAAGGAAVAAATASGDAGDVVASLGAGTSDAGATGADTAGQPPMPPSLRMPPTAGEPDDVAEPADDQELAALVKPASGTVAKGS